MWVQGASVHRLPSTWLLPGWVTLALWAALGYLIGSVPFGLIIARVMGLGNLRQIGSGNIGATNVLRTGSKPAAALTLLLDGGKGALAVLLARAYAGEDAAQIAALMAFLGHCLPVWLARWSWCSTELSTLAARFGGAEAAPARSLARPGRNSSEKSAAHNGWVVAPMTNSARTSTSDGSNSQRFA